MITCAEFTEDRAQRTSAEDVWFHVQDTLDYILNPSLARERTLFRKKLFSDEGRGASDVRRHMQSAERLLAEWQPPQWEKDDEDLQGMAFRRKYRTRHADTGDDIDVDRFLDGQRTDFWETTYKDKAETQAEAVTYLLDVTVPGIESDDPRLTEQARELYMMALRNERKGTPFRIIACCAQRYEENRAVRRFFLTVKDWAEPMNPNVFGWFSSNELANHFLCLLGEKLMGTGDMGAGSASHFSVNVDRDFPGEQVKSFPGNRFMTVID